MNKTIHQNKIHRSFVTIIICVLFTLLCGLLSGCGETSPAIQLSDSELTMYVGDSQMLKYTLADEDADVEWASSDTKIVSVRRGSIKANAEGTATVTATVGSYVAECLVTVLSREVTISQTTATIDLDSGINTVQLTATSSDGGTISWSTSDPELAMVENGLVTATGNDIGDVIITASRGAAKASCVVSIIMPSRPADYYKLSKETNANVMANPGKWFYFADGSNGTDHTFVEDPIHQNNSISVKLGHLNLASNRFFYLRYQSTFEVGEQFTVKFDLTIDQDAKFRAYSGSGSTVRNITAKANQKVEVSYLGVVSTSEPFSLRFTTCDALQNSIPTLLKLDNIRFELGDTGPVVEENPTRSDKADLPQYLIESARNAEIVLDRGAWYYSCDGTPGTDYAFADQPAYNNGVATMSFTHIAGYSSSTGKVTYQLRYQPDYEVGQYYKLTASINLTAAGRISYGTKVSSSEVYYTGLDFEEAGTQTIEFVGYVNGAFPFSVGITPVDPNSPIALNISNVIIEKTEKPVPDENSSYNLIKRTNAEVVANPGEWAYTAPTDAIFNSAPSYEKGVVTFDLAAGTVDGAYQLRYQPNLEQGTAIKVTATVELAGNGTFSFGNEKDMNLKYSKDLTPNANGTYSISWIGEVYEKPFYFHLKSNDTFATALKLVVSDFEYTTDFEVIPDTPKPEEPNANAYDLVKKTNAEVCAAPEVWAYTAPENTVFNSTPKYDNGVITFDLGANTEDGTYQLRYQPNLEQGTQYKVTATVELTGNGYFAYGNDKEANLKYSKDLVLDNEGKYQIEWVGEVFDKPFYFNVKSNDSFATAIKIVVSNFSYTTEFNTGSDTPVTPDGNVYELQNRKNSEVVANPDVWAYTAPESATLASTPKYDNGVITFELAAGNPTGDYQLRFQPNLEIGTEYSIHAKVSFEGNGYFLYGSDYKNSKDLTSDANGVYTVNWTGKVSNTPFYFIIKSNDSFATPLKLTVHEFSYEAKVNDGTSYTLAKKTNSEVCANPGVWAYTAPTGALFSEEGKYENGVITWGLAANTPNGDYQLRYQPNLEQETSYTVTATVTFEGNGYFLYGNDYKSSKNLTPNEDGSYSIAWTGTVSTTPFYFVMKTNDSFASTLKIVVRDFTVTTAN